MLNRISEIINIRWKTLLVDEAEELVRAFFVNIVDIMKPRMAKLAKIFIKVSDHVISHMGYYGLSELYNTFRINNIKFPT